MFEHILFPCEMMYIPGIIEKILQHPELLQEQSSLAYQVVRSRNQFSQYTSSLKNIIDGASNDR